MGSALTFPISKPSKNRIFSHVLMALSVTLVSVALASVMGSIVMGLIAIGMGLTILYHSWIIRNSAIHMEINSHGLVIRWARTHQILWGEIVAINDISPEVTRVQYKPSNRNKPKSVLILWQRIPEVKEGVLAQIETSFGQSLRATDNTNHTTPPT